MSTSFTDFTYVPPGYNALKWTIQHRYHWLTVFKHITFIMSYLFMCFIVVIKFTEWYRAIEIINKENKMDE